MELIKLLETILQINSIEILLKTSKNDINATDIYNQIRAIQGVVIVNVITPPNLKNKGDLNYDYSLIEIKYIGDINNINEIKSQALKIQGLVKFHLRSETLAKLK